MSLSKNQVNWITVTDRNSGQRLDNFLGNILRKVPRPHILKIIRKGQVRINSGRISHTYKIQEGDIVRIPPVDFNERPISSLKPAILHLTPFIIFEDEGLLVLNKPSGWAVHGGSGLSVGVIEQLRLERPECQYLELVHRLDRDTSGLLVVAKKRSYLMSLHEQWRQKSLQKHYVAFVRGAWLQKKFFDLTSPLVKYLDHNGERRVRVDLNGSPSHTRIMASRIYPEGSMLDILLLTGRTHQIRVHLSDAGFPLAGDDKYGDFPWNRVLQTAGLKRLFLHAKTLRIKHPKTQEPLLLEAPLPEHLDDFLNSLNTYPRIPLAR